MSIPETKPGELSEREHEILRLVATGASNKEIAQRLYISANTVKVHLRNIFAKISVTSRTEAALYAVREGLVQVAGDVSLQAQESNGAGSREVEASSPRPVSPPVSAEPAARKHAGLDAWRILWLITALVIIVLLGVRTLRGSLGPPPTASPASAALPTVAPIRWQARANMPTARSGLAVTTYENQVYAIGGETAQGVTASTERYDSASDTWATLTPKPAAVADVNAAVIGGQIYVPGGRLASGAVTNRLEVYDPRADRWEQRASLPIALSAYALAAFEGRLYLFGGWDGQRYLNSVYEYDPAQDAWIARTPMPTARGFAGAAVAGGSIYVIGGTDGERAQTANEKYSPDRDAPGGHPWEERAPLPEGRFGMGMASVVDIIHIVGGSDGNEAQPLPPIGYYPQRDVWQAFEMPTRRSWFKLGLVAVEADLHAIGGKEDSAPLARHLAYKAIYTIVIPIPS